MKNGMDKYVAKIEHPEKWVMGRRYLAYTPFELICFGAACVCLGFLLATVLLAFLI